MEDELFLASRIANAGLKAQATRLRVIAENLSNAESLSDTPGGEPYRRKLVTFKNELDRSLDHKAVKVDKIFPDRSQLERRYDPNHPAADAQGYVFMPNVNPLMELMDMREAQRTYEANLAVIQSIKAMGTSTLDLLKGQ